MMKNESQPAGGAVGRRSFLARIGGAAAFTLLSRSAHADIILPGTKRLVPRHLVDLGPYAPFAVHRHVVAKGDTFESLAVQYLLAAARSSEIQSSNPDVRPEKIKVGSVLAVPSRQAALGTPGAKKDALPAFGFYFVETRTGPNAIPVPRGEAIALGSNPLASWTIAAVPAAEVARFEALFERDAKGARRTAADVSSAMAALKVRLGPALEGVVTIPDSSRVKTLLHRHEIKAIDAQTITIATTKTENPKALGAEKPKKAMLGLSAGGLLVIAVFALRRRREIRSAGATVPVSAHGAQRPLPQRPDIR